SGQIVADFEIKHSASGWQRWREQVAALGPGVAVCVETSQGMIIEQLLESGVSLYPVSPVSSKAYRARSEVLTRTKSRLVLARTGCCACSRTRSSLPRRDRKALCPAS
ncbi:MAG: hypothetical protein WBW78_17990, partial [Terrimicrobiaceae bacterium]